MLLFSGQMEIKRETVDVKYNGYEKLLGNIPPDKRSGDILLPSEIKTETIERNFPMFIRYSSIDYNVVVTMGKSGFYRAQYSSVVLGVPDGPTVVVTQRIHTNLSRFSNIIPDDEYFIGPVAELHAKDLGNRVTDTSPMYSIKIPHCVRNPKYREHVRVRYGQDGNYIGP